MGMKVNNSKDAIKLLGTISGKSLAQISKEMGLPMPTYLVNAVNRKSLKVETLAEIAKVCGYEVRLVPKGVNIDNDITIVGGGRENDT